MNKTLAEEYASEYARTTGKSVTLFKSKGWWQLETSEGYKSSMREKELIDCLSVLKKRAAHTTK